MKKKSGVASIRALLAVDLTGYLGGVRKIRARWSSDTFITVKAAARVFWFRGQRFSLGPAAEALASGVLRSCGS